jgi:ligand-binding SRPBCC domain-containing protein
MRFERKFRVKATVGQVAEFHSRAASMGAITPPPMIVRVHSAPEQLKSGDVMDFTLWAGPVPVSWVARIDDASPKGFTDRQVRGPFRSWSHRHSFRAVDPQTTEVHDVIEASHRKHPFWGLVSRLMWLGMPLLFAFRARRTRALLEAA